MCDRRRVSVIVADELALVREGLALLCQREAEADVVAQCADGEEASRAIGALRPDIALLDLQLPKVHALDVIRKHRTTEKGCRMLITAPRNDRKTVLEVLRSGASGYLVKSGPSTQIRDAFECILNGQVYVSPLVEMEQLFIPSRAKRHDDPMDSLSSREYQVFCLLVDGLRAKEIAARLEVSPKTIDTYRSTLMRKLDIYDVPGLVKFAIQKNITSLR
jgi:DNA-binding NarL/FixJ family response regulator